MTTGVLVSIREAARRLNPPVTHPTVLNWLRAGHIKDHGTQKNLDSGPSRLVDMVEVAAYHEQSRQSRMSLVGRSNADRAAGIPPEGTPIAISEAARKYGISQSVVSTWAKNQSILVLQYQDGPGGVTLVDERSVWERKKTHRPKTRRGQTSLKGLGRAQSSRDHASPPRSVFQGPRLPSPLGLPGTERSRTAQSTGRWSCPECGAVWDASGGSQITE